MNEQDLIACFQDTQRVSREAFKEETRAMQAGTLLYFPGYQAVAPKEKSEGLPLEVMEDTSFHCARRFGNGRTAVLNFANAYNPGGGVASGVMAQEECLCRSSNLYLSLTLPYLMRNYYRHNSRAVGYMGTDAVIYSPDVTVFKSDDALPVPLPEPFSVDVLTCAAPYNEPKKAFAESKLSGVFEARIRNIAEVAAARDADTLILGAFGCGAFMNPPEMVARAFRRVLVEKEYRRYFRRVIFAIKGGSPENPNFQAFSRVLDEM